MIVFIQMLEGFIVAAILHACQRARGAMRAARRVLRRSMQSRRLGRGGLAALIAILALAGALAGCSSAPGMRMSQPATLPTGEGTDSADGASSDSAQAQQQIPITEINLRLIQQLRAAAAPDNTWTMLEASSQPLHYTLGPGDVLDITVWDHPELIAAQSGQANSVSAQRSADPAPGFVIDQDGYLQFPYVGREHVAGMHIEDVQRLVQSRLSEVYQKPQVTVRIVSYRSKQIYVDGEVQSPGSLAINDVPMTLYQAVARAGGFTKNADQSQMVLVRDGKSYRLDLPAMLARNENPAKIRLQKGDLLRVVAREDNGVYVMGEVSKPVTAVPMRNGKLMLSDAISQAGSIDSNTADPQQLYVIRGAEGTQPQVYHLDARSPVSMILANQFQLQSNDVVYVDSNGLVRLSRVLNLLLPAINAGLTAAVLTK
ncbi:polysaccharide export outer membrane protein [Paraburkholderia bannensis]|uniref:Polysaccharide export outer membrane protein n=2 Tax=Burkholderiaceae TaxID=119060 RepID=A0A7W9WWH0_9BURK|nr:polysaccharide biosynthesis/export family protein [Paraburkholderia bannensis]MBB3260951.1 polysaccharide export outer membrane protein [Paraburkholderia sp. WP4_3_2]MBB6105988.1 polysaccharide export outer membrane protein [Paraburkholderia bannensis]